MYLEDDTDLDAVLTRTDAPIPQLERIYPGLASRSATFELLGRYSPGNAYARLGHRAGQWFEVSEDIYRHFLEVLPPLYMTSGGFVMGECTRDNLYDCFFEIRGRFYCATLAWSGPRSFAALWTALLGAVAR